MKDTTQPLKPCVGHGIFGKDGCVECEAYRADYKARNIAELNEARARFRIVRDAHGTWAHDEGNAFYVEEGKDGKPYLLSSPIMSTTNEPPWAEMADGYEIGEPCWGMIDKEDEDYCHWVESELFPAWEADGRPAMVWVVEGANNG